MKIIYPNVLNLYGGGPAETKPNFPYLNIADPHVLKVWKADTTVVNEVVLHFTTSLSDHDTIALFGLSADSLRIQIFSDETMTQEVHDSGVQHLKYYDRFGDVVERQFWESFSRRTAQSWIQVTLGASTLSEVSLGVASIGLGVSFVNPTWSGGQSLTNHSVIKEMKNGSHYRLKKPISRKVECTLELPTKNDGRAKFYELIRLYERSNCEDLAVLWAEGLTDQSGKSLDHEHMIWGSFGTDFKPTEGKYSLSTINFTLTEGL